MPVSYKIGVYMFERTKDNSLPYPENLIKAIGFDKNDNIDIEELYDTVQYKTTPPNKELLIEYFRDNIKMSDLGKMHNLSTERIRQKIRLSIYDMRRHIINNTTNCAHLFRNERNHEKI